MRVCVCVCKLFTKDFINLLIDVHRVPFTGTSNHGNFLGHYIINQIYIPIFPHESNVAVENNGKSTIYRWFSHEILHLQGISHCHV